MKNIFAILLAMSMLFSSIALAAPDIDTSQLTTAFEFDFSDFTLAWSQLAAIKGCELTLDEIQKEGDFSVYSCVLNESIDEVFVYTNQDSQIMAFTFHSVLSLTGPAEEQFNSSARLGNTSINVLQTPLFIDHNNIGLSYEDYMGRMTSISTTCSGFISNFLQGNLATAETSQLISGITDTIEIENFSFSCKMALDLSNEDHVRLNVYAVFAPNPYIF